MIRHSDDEIIAHLNEWSRRVGLFRVEMLQAFAILEGNNDDADDAFRGAMDFLSDADGELIRAASKIESEQPWCENSEHRSDYYASLGVKTAAE